MFSNRTQSNLRQSDELLEAECRIPVKLDAWPTQRAELTGRRPHQQTDKVQNFYDDAVGCGRGGGKQLTMWCGRGRDDTLYLHFRVDPSPGNRTM